MGKISFCLKQNEGNGVQKRHFIFILKVDLLHTFTFSFIQIKIAKRDFKHTGILGFDNIIKIKKTENKNYSTKSNHIECLVRAV